MLANSRHHTRARRGIVLVLVLGMLGLLALIGVTFATFSGQARVNARNFAQAQNQLRSEDLMDYALSQLVLDTNNPQSAIRGHSLLRDMYGNDAWFNGYLGATPSGGTMTILSATPGSAAFAGTYQCITSMLIPSSDPTFYGYDFTR